MLIRHRISNSLVTIAESDRVNYSEAEWEYNPSPETLAAIAAEQAAALAEVEQKRLAAVEAAAAREDDITALIALHRLEIDAWRASPRSFG